MHTLWAAGWSVVTVFLLLNVYVHNFPFFRGCAWSPGAEIRILGIGDPQITGFSPTMKFRKRLDVAGNDYFLAHTVRTVRNSLHPQYAIVLGDLISSQWIETPEFEARAQRFSRIFPPSQDELLFNVSGNHDIGYHGEMTLERVSRYMDHFGAVNFVHNVPEQNWRLVVVNTLALDGDDYGPHRGIALRFLEELKNTPFSGQTVLAIHIPLYKPEGICHDGPCFAYYEGGARIKAQNHLTFASTQLLLNSVFANGLPGFVLTGHDHEGCLTSYSKDADGNFIAAAGLQSDAIQEATVRSIMGEYGGNTGLLSGVWDPDLGVYRFEYSLCPFFVQHLWWAATGACYVGLAALTLVPLIIFAFARARRFIL